MMMIAREERMKERLLELKLSSEEQIRISSAGSSVWVSQATSSSPGVSNINISSSNNTNTRSVSGTLYTFPFW